jgi:hypothetical protein
MPRIFIANLRPPEKGAPVRRHRRPQWHRRRFVTLEFAARTYGYAR